MVRALSPFVGFVVFRSLLTIWQCLGEKFPVIKNNDLGETDDHVLADENLLSLGDRNDNKTKAHPLFKGQPL